MCPTRLKLHSAGVAEAKGIRMIQRQVEDMYGIWNGFKSLEIKGKGVTERTKAVKTKLCEIGRDSDCQVYATGVDHLAAYKEWLYDVTWLKYSQGDLPGLQNELLDVYLVAECEWGGLAEIKSDFEKLLLAPPSALRFMIYDGNRDPGGPKAIADRLAGYVKTFAGHFFLEPWAEAWLLAGLDSGGMFNWLVITPEGVLDFPYDIDGGYWDWETGQAVRQGPPPPPSQPLLVRPEDLLHRTR